MNLTITRLLAVSAILLATSGCVPGNSGPATGCQAPADIIDQPAVEITVQVDCTVAPDGTFVNAHVAGLDPFADAAVGLCGNAMWLLQGCSGVTVTADAQGVATTEVFVSSTVYHDDSPVDCTQGSCAIHAQQLSGEWRTGEGPALTVIAPS